MSNWLVAGIKLVLMRAPAFTPHPADHRCTNRIANTRIQMVTAATAVPSPHDPPPPADTVLPAPTPPPPSTVAITAGAEAPPAHSWIRDAVVFTVP